MRLIGLVRNKVGPLEESGARRSAGMGRRDALATSRKLRVMRQPGETNGVLILKIFASAMARERLSAMSSGSPMGLASNFATSSWT